MFGNNAITSTWGQNNSANPPQQPNAFGQPSGFGSTGFGSTTGTSAFGQPSQPANPMFGGLGAGSSTTPSSGFGAFGSTSNQNTAVNPMFGGTKPATGFGAFGGGGTSAFGGGGTSSFGQTGTGTSAFGQPATNTSTSAFGAGGSSIFGANKATSAFGGTTTTPSSQPVTTGSSNPPYATTTEKDTTTNTNLQYQAISCMPAYQGTSFEELRYQDYQQNRKTASTNAFGQTSFGGAQSTGSGLFGGGQNTQQNTQPNSIFGARPAGSGFGAFGGANTGTTTGTTNSIFGGGTNATTSAFGQPQQQPQTSTFGTFGQPQSQPQQQTGSLFPNTGTSGAFGPSTGGAFGSGNTGAFGPTPAQQPQQTSMFGQPQNTSTGTTGAFGAFGNTANANKPSIFGQPTGQPTQPTTTGFSSNIFGSQPNQQQQNPTPSLFGNTGGNNPFGNTNANQPQQSQPAGNSLFGNTQNTGTTPGGLFGGGGFGLANQNQPQQQNQQPATSAFGGGLFSAGKPATNSGTGLFGSFNVQQPANNQGGGLFGNSINQSTNQQQSTLGASGSLFGPKPPMIGQSTSTGGNAGLFGSTFTPSTSTLNASASNAGVQGTLTASISQPIGANLPIFSMLPPGPRAIDLEQSTKKKPSFFVDMPTRSPLPRMSYTPTSSKLRGFGPSPTKSGIFNISMNGNALTLSRSQSPSIFNGRPASPSLGSGQRKSVKKLILDKKVEPTDLFIKSSESPGKIVFSPALGISAREKEAAALVAAASPPAKSPTPPRPTRTPNKFTASQSNPGADDSGDLQEGDYYVKPDLTTLKNAGYDQLTSYKELVVGRVGYGEIHFLEPVDLTGLPKLGALLGEVIRFEEKECSVYPDSEEVDKPPPGSGLNVKARIILERCWATGKAHREPIKDEDNPIAIRHLKRLKGMKDTHFESFDISDGTWTFTVDHF